MSDSEEEEVFLPTFEIRYRVKKSNSFAKRRAIVNPHQLFSYIPEQVADEAGLTGDKKDSGNEMFTTMKMEANIEGKWVPLSDSTDERIEVHWFTGEFGEAIKDVTLSGKVLKHSKKTTVVSVEPESKKE
jgi:hypothetical protein